MVNGYIQSLVTAGMLTTDFRSAERVFQVTPHGVECIREGVTKSPSPTSSEVLVDETRIKELEAVNSPNFDCTRLICLCEELNTCYANECWLAVSALTRTIMNHVPPVLGQKNFSEVMNNYSGGQSFKKSMQNLDSAKHIGDRHLHQQIGKTATLPNKVQVNFSNDLDVLLEKIIERLK